MHGVDSGSRPCLLFRADRPPLTQGKQTCFWTSGKPEETGIEGSAVESAALHIGKLDGGGLAAIAG
jgi:hypothetical protein